MLALPCPALLAQIQPAQVNYFLNSDQAPGVVGSARVLRGGPAVGFFQPVEVSAPSKCELALANEGQFLRSLTAPIKVGMLVGSVYRLRVTNIPFRPGDELYPTIEVLDRLYAPRGREHRFPIPIVLEQDELVQALEGALITRVVYLEDSLAAERVSDQAGEQRVIDVEPSANALQVADQLGRPVAIVRIGSRVPSQNCDMTAFLYGCPPWISLPPVPTRQGLVEAGIWAETMPTEPSKLRHEPPERDEPRIPAIR